MPILFEHGDWVTIQDRVSLERLLEEIWSLRNPAMEGNEPVGSELDRRFQPILQFDGQKARANNYAGFIQDGDEVIEIFPKVFRHLPGAQDKKELMLRHIFYWLNYCRRWRFPFSKSSLDHIDIDKFPELMINLIANQFLEAVSSSPFSMYQPVEESLQTPRGAINFKRYVGNTMSRGNYQNIDCDYEPFIFDNKVNRIIKHCARLLLNQTKVSENQRLLQEVTFVLCDVEDVAFRARDLDGVSLNPLFADYVAVLESCRMVLNQQLYSSNFYELSQWCLLLPMEYIFEDFVAGFLETHFGAKWRVEYQKSDLYVSNSPRAFRMQHDIFLTSKDGSGRKIIVDTKYKLRDLEFKSDVKKGISQNDLYQMITYSVKRGCTQLLLLYPNIAEEVEISDEFLIESGIAGQDKIVVTATEIPFWSFTGFDGLDGALDYTLRKVLDRLSDQE